MPKVILTKEQRLADRIIKCLPQQQTVASELGYSQQTTSYRINHVYPKAIVEVIKLMKLAGYDVVESESYDIRD